MSADGHGEVDFTPDQRQGLDLMAQIVSANVDAAARTTDTLLALKDADIRDLANTVITFWDIFERATVVDRATEDLLGCMSSKVHAARRTLERLEDFT